MKKLLLITLVLMPLLLGGCSKDTEIYVEPSAYEKNKKVLQEIKDQKRQFICEKNKGKLSHYEISYICEIGNLVYTWNQDKFIREDILK